MEIVENWIKFNANLHLPWWFEFILKCLISLSYIFCKCKQYKNANIANFVYYEKTLLQLMDLKLRGKVKAILISKCTNYSLSKLFILFIDHNMFSIRARNTHISNLWFNLYFLLLMVLVGSSKSLFQYGYFPKIAAFHGIFENK